MLVRLTATTTTNLILSKNNFIIYWVQQNVNYMDLLLSTKRIKFNLWVRMEFHGLKSLVVIVSLKCIWKQSIWSFTQNKTFKYTKDDA